MQGDLLAYILQIGFLGVVILIKILLLNYIFPDNLPTGNYEIRLRVEYSSNLSSSIPIRTKINGINQCIQTFQGTNIISCDLGILSCIYFQDCLEINLSCGHLYSQSVTATITEGSGAYFYTWYIQKKNTGETFIESGFDKTSVKKKCGLWGYTLSVQDLITGCIVQHKINCTKICPISTNDEQIRFRNSTTSENNVTLFPNPTRDLLNIKLDDNEAQKVYLQVIDILGAIKMEYSTEATPGSSLQLNTSELQDGIYFLRIQYPDNNKIIKKFSIKK